MIATIGLLLVGAAAVAAAIVLRKKLGIAWMCSVIVAGAVLLVCGGALGAGQVSADRAQRQAVYMGLQYLERQQTDSAAFYLKKAGGDDFVSASAKYLLEQMRGNDISARMNRDSASALANNQDKKDLLDLIDGLDIQQTEQLTLVTGKLSDMLGFSAGKEAEMDAYLDAESGGYSDSDHLDSTSRSRLSISSSLAYGNYSSAVYEAAALVERDPSADNRLLLAETVAESAYNGVELGDDVFAQTGLLGASAGGTSDAEREHLDEQRTELEQQLLEVQMALNGASDADKQDELARKEAELSQEIQQLQQDSDKLYVRRAFNSIADLHSLEAELVRARLYFALEQKDEAVDAILRAADSLQAKLTGDTALSNSLRVVQQAYDSQGGYYESQEFEDAVAQLLAAPFDDLMYISQTAISKDFTQQILSDQKVYGRSLAISGFDLSQYPTVTVTLSGREEALETIVDQKADAVRDTSQDVSYTASMEESGALRICLVVDRSGSMDGQPMNDLKQALRDFVQDLDEGTSLSLVAFDSGAECLVELTEDSTVLLNTVDNLYASGGTDITSGIRSGTQTLSGAGGGQVMLLLTDGQSDIDFAAVEEAAAQGITIHTIGFGSVNDTLLQEIADRTGGQYVRADSSQELRNVYASLQQIIGNTVTVEYTVSNPEQTDRYFFIDIGTASVRREYFPNQEDDTAPVLYDADPSILSLEELEWKRQWGYTCDLRFEGENLSQVSLVTVGGQPATVEETASDYLRVSIQPNLSAGWQPVVLTMQDGSVHTWDRLLLVGETVTLYNLRMGSITVPYASGVLTGDGNLVLSDFSMEENRSEDSTLHVSLDGVLIVPWTPVSVGSTNGWTYSDVNLGDTGTATGWGVVRLNYGDSANTYGGPETVAQGSLTLEYAADQSRIIQNDQSAQGGNP